MSFLPSDIAYIQIFPPIGIARLGDSGFDLNTGRPDGEIEWFLPSEIPGTEDMPVSLQGKFRDCKNRIKRQVRLEFSFVIFRIALNLAARRLFVSVSMLIEATALYSAKSRQGPCIPSPGASMSQITRVHTTSSQVCPKSFILILCRNICSTRRV